MMFNAVCTIERSNMKVLCLADETGVIGFEIPSDQIVFAKLRARREREKNSVLFKINLRIKQKADIRELLDKNENREALEYIKEIVKKSHQIDFPSDLIVEFTKSWKRIPFYDKYGF